MKAKDTTANNARTNTTVVDGMMARLQRSVDELSEVAYYFELLDMLEQRDRLCEAADKIEDVQEVIDCLLGRVQLAGYPVPSAPARKRRKSKKLVKMAVAA